MNSFMVREASFSPCKTWRYKLRRSWDDKKPYIMFVGVNPSKADEHVDDPTVKKCMRWAMRLGYGGILMMNLFGYKATNPADMRRAARGNKKQKIEPVDIIGEGNNQALLEVATAPLCGKIICAWGKNGLFQGRDKSVLQMLKGESLELNYLRLLPDGTPEHPLYIPEYITPQKWTP